MFEVLRSASDEVNLHSRFLYALLVHIDPVSDERENLAAFVREVLKSDDFALANARVERESNHIDLLISNRRQAIVVENKIWAADQEQQLQRYRDSLVHQGFSATSIRLVYLTLYGDEPSERSRGTIPAEEIQRVSYRDHLPAWLIGCQRRAFDEPGLRESIAQYRRLILAMTSNYYEPEHMVELKKLLLDGNVVLAGQISKALVEAEADLVRKFYEVLRDAIKCLYNLDSELTPVEGIRKFIVGRRGSRCGLNCQIAENAWLHVGGGGTGGRLWFGVSCAATDDADLHEKLKTALAGVGANHRADSSTPWWQWLDELPAWGSSGQTFDIRDANESTLELLSSEAKSREFAWSVAHALRAPWTTTKGSGLARSV